MMGTQHVYDVSAAIKVPGPAPINTAPSGEASQKVRSFLSLSLSLISLSLISLSLSLSLQMFIEILFLIMLTLYRAYTVYCILYHIYILRPDS